MTDWAVWRSLTVMTAVTRPGSSAVHGSFNSLPEVIGYLRSEPYTRAGRPAGLAPASSLECARFLPFRLANQIHHPLGAHPALISHARSLLHVKLGLLVQLQGTTEVALA